MIKSTERIIPDQWQGSVEEQLLYLRHVFAYEFALTLVKPGQEVLEIGSGDGYGTEMLCRAGATVVGLDLSAEAVAHASEKHKANNLTFVAYDGMHMPFADAKFGLAVSFQVIEHVEDVPLYLAEIHRVLAPGGTLLITTPNRAYRLRPSQKPWNKFHRREYDVAGLREELRTRFDSVEVWGVRGTDEIQRIEKARVAWALKPGPAAAIRRTMPEWLRRMLGKVMKRSSPNPAGSALRFKSSDYSVTRESVEDSLDLLAVCVR